MSNRKNILLIGMDDCFSFWRFRTSFGARLLTPNLDRICAESTAFKAAYCQIPICGPSRASAMSGLSPYETGIFDNYTSIFDTVRPDQMWQHRLKEDGYFCSSAGKIHHGYKPLHPKVEEALYSHSLTWIGFGPHQRVPHKKVGGRTGGVGTTNPNDDAEYYDAKSAADAVKFLKNYDRTQPFYREVGFHHPHPSFKTPIRYKDMYDIADFIRPEDWEEGFDLSEFTATFMPENMDTNADVTYWQQSVRNYFSALTHVDHHIGEVWDALKASKHADNTIVVVFSDHGYHMGDKNRFRKFTLWEEATQIPFIIHDPSAPAQTINDPIALADMGPTILDYANARPIHLAVGKSLRPIVNGGRDPDRAVPTFWHGSASIRKGDYRITIYQDGSSEFYNLTEDPWQTKNLAGKIPQYAAFCKELVSTCKDYGVSLILPDDKTHHAANYISLVNGAVPPEHLPSNGIISVGDIKGSHEPGYRKHHATLKLDGTLSISEGFKELLFASDNNGGVEHFRVTCNDQGNRVYFFAGHRRFTLEVLGGAGGDTIETQTDSLVAHLGSGHNTVRAGGADGQIYGGYGTDTIHAIAGTNLIHGGAGNSSIYGGSGNDTIYTGSGVNFIKTGGGTNKVIIDGGTNRVLVGSGQNKIILKRTARLQTIENFQNGVIDLSDWAELGPATLSTSDTFTTLTCGEENIIFTSTALNTISSNIVGIQI